MFEDLLNNFNLSIISPITNKLLVSIIQVKRMSLAITMTYIFRCRAVPSKLAKIVQEGKTRLLYGITLKF